MPNVVINGFGYRRTGVVNRPQIELTTPLDVSVTHLTVFSATLVPEAVFTVEFELLDSPDLVATFTDLADADVVAEDVTQGETS